MNINTDIQTASDFHHLRNETDRQEQLQSIYHAPDQRKQDCVLYKSNRGPC